MNEPNTPSQVALPPNGPGASTGTASEVAAAAASCTQESQFDTKYPHLYVETAAFIERSVKERVVLSHRDKYILHENAKTVLSAMKDLYYRPRGVRPGCLAVIGNTNEGKTATANRFYEDMCGGSTQLFSAQDEMPIVKVEMPPRSTEPRLCLAIARALGLTGYANSKARQVTDNVYRALVAKKVQLLILVEFQHVSPLPAFERHVVYDLVKGISNHGISIVAIGTEEARIAMAEDPQVSNRMRVVRLNGFRKNDSMRDFLHSLEPFYPLTKPSALDSIETSTKIYERTNGITGEIVMLCNAAAAWAVKNGRPCIDAEALAKCMFYPAANAA